MRDYFLDADAMDDLDSIYEYVARNNRTAAAKTLRDLDATFEIIAANPDAGRPCNELVVSQAMFCPLSQDKAA